MTQTNDYFESCIKMNKETLKEVEATIEKIQNDTRMEYREEKLDRALRLRAEIKYRISRLNGLVEVSKHRSL